MAQDVGYGADIHEGDVKPVTAVGYRRPPLHSRFKPGQSGNPSGRPKGSQNLQTLFHKILNERISLREGARVRTISKAEAVMRGLVIGAMKGEPRSVMTLFRLAEQTGQLAPTIEPQQVIIRWMSQSANKVDSVV